jgi:hypothetical protein
MKAHVLRLMHFLSRTLSAKSFRYSGRYKVDSLLPKFFRDGYPRLLGREPHVLLHPHSSPQPFLDPVDRAPEYGLNVRAQLLQLLDVPLQNVDVRVDVKDSGPGNRI